jgi:hypothetical protein
MTGAKFLRGLAVATAFTAGAVFSMPALAGGGSYGGGSLKDSGPEMTYPLVTISGLDVTKNAYESYSGLFYALNGDLNRDGFVLRLLGTMGAYDYRNGGTKFDADYWQGDAMIGYQWVRGGVDVAVYVGVDYQHHKIEPYDPANDLRGAETGFKVAGDITTNHMSTSPLYFHLGGSYSTAFDTYYGLARVGHKFGHVTIGPEGWVLGDLSGDAQRLGAFLSFDIPISPSMFGTLAVSAGYQFGSGDGFGGRNFDDGMYGTLEFRIAYGR